METLAFYSEAENGPRWKATIFDGPEKMDLDVCVEKWRPPYPHPKVVNVKIDKMENFTENYITKSDIEKKPELRENNLYAMLKKMSNGTKVVRFSSANDFENSGIGDVYNPQTVLDEIGFAPISNYVDISVEWFGGKANLLTAFQLLL